MKFKVASAIHVILAVAGIVFLFYAAAMNFPFAGPAGYAIIFVVIPLVAAYGIWKQKYWGLVVGLVFFLPQCINYVGEVSSFQFMAPISLGITSEASGEGAFYIFNLFAIGMAVFLVVLLKAGGGNTPNKSSQPTL
ncbi:MAG: hypothetical protein V7721_09730 [Porticoccaceae bacterium]